MIELDDTFWVTHPTTGRPVLVIEVEKAKTASVIEYHGRKKLDEATRMDLFYANASLEIIPGDREYNQGAEEALRIVRRALEVDDAWNGPAGESDA